ncbi:MAG: 2-dehydropantoate 2-reductase [Planctomycetes bacterium]|nr:2-dehydropantoate 2-reductase [Planctomycetota bacterium]
MTNENPERNFIMIGAGAVGGLLGALLADAGHRVIFVVRGRTYDALTTRGLRVDSILGQFTIPKPTVISNISELTGNAIAIVAVKGYDYSAICGELSRATGYSGLILSILNGAFAVDDAVEALGARRIIGAICRVVSAVVEPGVIRHTAMDPSIEMQALDDTNIKIVDAAAEAFRAARIRATISTNIRVAIWEKLAFVASVGVAGAAANATIGELRNTPEKQQVLAELVAEIISIGRASGAPIPATSEAKTMEAILRVPGASIPSLQRDLAAGGKSELDWQVGRLLPVAEKLQIQTPRLKSLYAELTRRSNKS